jgi:hypothetical protein
MLRETAAVVPHQPHIRWAQARQEDSSRHQCAPKKATTEKKSHRGLTASAKGEVRGNLRNQSTVRGGKGKVSTEAQSECPNLAALISNLLGGTELIFFRRVY